MRLAVATVAFVGLLVAAPAPAPAQDTPVTYTPPPPQAWVLVDADTGAVIDAHQERNPLPPASTIKILTALVAVEQLPPDDLVPISPLAEGMPARKINVKAGQVWDREDLLHSMMMVSANDAAVALAERVGGGTLDGYEVVVERAADNLGLSDDPVLSDPSGLDDEFSRHGGSLISARDLAIVTRAALARPELVAIASTPYYEFTGGDGIFHTFGNHNRFLRMYEGATGMKTGLTDRAGRCLVATATRGGRTMLAVMFDAPDIYASAALLLDQGFATPVAAETGLDRLPAVVVGASTEAPTRRHDPPAGVPAGASSEVQSGGASGVQAVADDPVMGVDRAAKQTGVDLNSAPVAVGLLLVGTIPAIIVVYRRRYPVSSSQ